MLENVNIITPEYFFGLSKQAIMYAALNVTGGKLYTNLSNHYGFDVEMDHFAIFLPNKTGFVYGIDGSEDSLLQKIIGFHFVCTTGCGPCVTICGYLHKDNELYQAIAHVSAANSLNDVLDLLLKRLIEHSNSNDKVPVTFFLFGGTKESFKDFLSLDGGMLSPNEYSFVDLYPRLINGDEDSDMSIFMTSSKIIIFEFDINFKNVKNHEQAIQFGNTLQPYNQASNPNEFVFKVESVSSSPKASGNEPPVIREGKEDEDEEEDEEITSVKTKQQQPEPSALEESAKKRDHESLDKIHPIFSRIPKLQLDLFPPRTPHKHETSSASTQSTVKKPKKE